VEGKKEVPESRTCGGKEEGNLQNSFCTGERQKRNLDDQRHSLPELI